MYSVVSCHLESHGKLLVGDVARPQFCGGDLADPVPVPAARPARLQRVPAARPGRAPLAAGLLHVSGHVNQQGTDDTSLAVVSL